MSEKIDFTALVRKAFDKYVASLPEGNPAALTGDEVETLARLLWNNKFDENPREFEKAVQDLVAAKAAI